MAKANRSSTAKKSRKTDWYREGREAAQAYWKSLREDPEGEHIGGYIGCLAEILAQEGKDASESEYVVGLGDGFQTEIESLLADRAAIKEQIDALYQVTALARCLRATADANINLSTIVEFGDAEVVHVAGLMEEKIGNVMKALDKIGPHPTVALQEEAVAA